jgi:hypothetical protein
MITPAESTVGKIDASTMGTLPPAPPAPVALTPPPDPAGDVAPPSRARSVSSLS